MPATSRGRRCGKAEPLALRCDRRVPGLRHKVPTSRNFLGKIAHATAMIAVGLTATRRWRVARFAVFCGATGRDGHRAGR